MARSVGRKGLASLVKLTAAAGANLARKWKDVDRRDVARLAVGASLATWALAGRWALYPFLGAGKLDEPADTTGSACRMHRPDGTDLHAEVFGPEDAPTLVLTHGWEHDSGQWYYMTRDLANRFRLIVWDLPGSGKSSKPFNNDYSLEKMACDLEAVVELAGRPVVLVGHSLGGMVVQTFCRLFPQHLGSRVHGLVLIDTTYTNPMKTARGSAFWQAIQSPILVPLWYGAIAMPPLARAMIWLGYSSGSIHLMKRLLGFAGSQTWRQVDFAARLTARSRAPVIARMALAARDFDEWNTLPGIQVPVLVIADENDRITTIEANREIQRRLPAGLLVSLAHAGHYAIFEKHEAVCRAVADFVATCHGDSSRSLAEPIPEREPRWQTAARPINETSVD